MRTSRVKHRSPAQDTAAPSRPAQAEEQECNVKEAARIVYGDPPPEQELNPEEAQALCEKAEIPLAELEAIEDGQENPGSPRPARHRVAKRARNALRYGFGTSARFVRV